MKETACALPSDPGSVHFAIREQAMALFQSTAEKIVDHTCDGILFLLSDPCLKSESGLPTDFIKIRNLVKGDCGGSGGSSALALAGKLNQKSTNSKILQFLPFSERTFIVYVADVVEALLLKPKIDLTELVYPYEDEVAFLALVDGVMDTNRCCKANVLAATEGLLLLGVHWQFAISQSVSQSLSNC